MSVFLTLVFLFYLLRVSSFVCVIGGRKGNQPSATVECYIKGQWVIHTAELNMPRFDHSTGIIDGSTCVIGGYGTGTTECWSNGEWVELTSHLNTPRSGHSTAILHGNTCVIGGIGKNGNFLQSIECFIEKSWVKQLSELDQPRAWHTTANILGHVCVIGGENENGPILIIECQVDLNSGRKKMHWVLTQPKLLVSKKKMGHMQLILDSVPCLVGGMVNDITFAQTTECLHNNREWIQLPALTVPRAEYSIGFIDNNQCLIGGSTIGGQKLKTVECYGGGLWSTHPSSLSEQRCCHTTGILCDIGYQEIDGICVPCRDGNCMDLEDFVDIVPKSRHGRFYVVLMIGGLMCLGGCITFIYWKCKSIITNRSSINKENVALEKKKKRKKNNADDDEQHDLLDSSSR